MIHQLGVELRAALGALAPVACPLPVVDGPEPAQTTTFGRERIVIEHDYDASERFVEPRSQHQITGRPGNFGPQQFNRHIAAKLSIYGQSSSPGALHWEHRRRVEHLLDLVLVQLRAVTMRRKNWLVLTGGRFFVPADLKATEIAGGAAYELKFTVERGVYEQDYAGNIAGTFKVIDGSIAESTSVGVLNSGQAPESA